MDVLGMMQEQIAIDGAKELLVLGIVGKSFRAKCSAQEISEFAKKNVTDPSFQKFLEEEQPEKQILKDSILKLKSMLNQEGKQLLTEAIKEANEVDIPEPNDIDRKF